MTWLITVLQLNYDDFCMMYTVFLHVVFGILHGVLPFGIPEEFHLRFTWIKVSCTNSEPALY